jgi:hypothetical protein
MTLRRAALGAALLSSALVMNGCVIFAATPIASQNGVIGSVRITFTVCATQMGSGSPPSGACTTSNGNSSQAAASAPSQVWLGFRVVAGAIAPASFTSSSTGPGNTGPQLQFTQSPAYASELQRLEPADAGERWVGYASQYVSYSATSGDQRFTAAVDFGLPKGPNGAPFQGPFPYFLVVGGRQNFNLGTPDPNEPIDCQSSLTMGWGTGTGPSSGEHWICVDDPPHDEATVLLPTRDAGIIPGLTAPATPGITATVPFTFDFAGEADPSATFTFSAATTLPGASAGPRQTMLTPASNSQTAVLVSVPVPRKARPGTYTVTLVARLEDGESRSGTASLVVPQVCRVPRLRGKTFRGARKSLNGARCRLGKVTHRHAKVKKGKIISERPAAGSIFPSGTKVSITVSLGP